MEELAFQFMPKVKFLSLIRADITYLQDERQFYFDKVVQPIFHCFGCSEARIVLEYVDLILHELTRFYVKNCVFVCRLDHLIDFMLKDDKVIHEVRPEGKIVGGKVFEFDNNLAKESKKIEGNAIEAPSLQETIVVEEVPMAPVKDTNE